ncbi:MAG: RAD55 family ATPase, partial [Planctomycetota bacterium]
QLSIARDSSQLRVPPRGQEPLPFGPIEIGKAFEGGSGPAKLSSTIVIAEPGTRYTSFALRFLTEGIKNDEPGLLVSTKEDQDAILRICRQSPSLRPLLHEGGGALSRDFRLLYLHPEFLSAGKFSSDILRMIQPSPYPSKEPKVARLAFDNIFRLHRRFPLLEAQDFLIAALLDLLRYQQVTPLFVDLIPPCGRNREMSIDPSMHLSTFDNVLHLFVREEAEGKHIPHVRILKSVGNDFDRTPFPVSI